MILIKFAWRNLWRNTRRTLATTGAMTLAFLVTLLYSGLIEGFLVNMEKDALEFEISSAQIFAKGYSKRPSLYTSMTDSADIIEKLDKEGIKASSRLLGSGLAAAGNSSAGVQLRGIDVEREKQVLLIHEQVADGKWLDVKNPKGVVIGRQLARTLNIKVSDEVVILSQAADGSIANDLYQVRGILLSVGELTDRAGFLMTSNAYKELMSYDNGAHQIVVRRPEKMLLADLDRKMQAIAGQHDAKTWRKLVPILATYFDSARGMILFFFFILNTVVGIVILNAMLMAVFERIKEFGVFKAIGASPLSVLRLVFYESMMQVCLAVIIGTILSLPIFYYLVSVGINMKSLAGVSVMGMAMMTHWKAIVSAETYASPIFMMFFVVGCAVIYPALKAAFVKPVEAMGHQ